MPIYEYVCQNPDCGQVNEVIHKVSDPQPEHCEFCSEPGLTRKTSIPSFHLKGGGWYKDGYGSEKQNSKKEENPKTPQKDEKGKNGNQATEAKQKESPNKVVEQPSSSDKSKNQPVKPDSAA